MADPVQSLHPRKLYDMLAACTSLDARARAALAFLRGCTGSVGGFLFLAEGEGLVLKAQTTPEPPSPELSSEAERVWRRELEAERDDGQTRTVDLRARKKSDPAAEGLLWSDTKGVAYERRMLATYRGPRFVPVGIVLLQAAPAVVALRHAHVEAICNAFIDAGEIVVPANGSTLVAR
jgi:hypothetical protein